MKKTIIFLVVLVFIQVGCMSHFPIELKGEAKIIRQLENGDYVVTPGYVKRYFDLYLEKAESIKEVSKKGRYAYARMETMKVTVAEYLDGSVHVKPKMVEMVTKTK